MSIITWDPIAKQSYSDIELTNRNLTATSTRSTIGSYRYVKSTEGKINGKWYWEIIITQLYQGNRSNINILQKNAGLYDITSNSIYVVISGTDTKINNGTTTLSTSTKVVKNGDIMGFALDVDNNFVTVYVNGEILFKDIKTPFTQEVYPSVSVFGNSTPSIITANFGLSKFIIVDKNDTEWYRLVSEGYLPFDIINANWFSSSIIKYNNDIFTLKDEVAIYLNNRTINTELLETNGIPFQLLEREINKNKYEMKFIKKMDEYLMYSRLLSINNINKINLDDKWIDEYFLSKYGISWFKLDDIYGNISDHKDNYIGVSYNLRYDIEEGINFNGTSSYIQCNNPVTSVGKKSIYFEIKTTTSNTSMIITQTAGSAGKGSQILLTNTGKIQFMLGKGIVNIPAIPNILTSTSINDGNWHKILITWDGTTNINGVKLYVDNLSIPDNNGTALDIETLTPSYNLSIGRGYDSNNYYYFNGSLRNIKIYNDVIEYPRDLSLIKSNNKHYSFNKEINSLQDINIINPTKLDFETYGVNDVIINKEALDILESNEFEVISLVEDTIDYDNNKLIEIDTTELFKPIDLLNKEAEFEVINYSEKYNLIDKQVNAVEEVLDDINITKFVINNPINKVYDYIINEGGI